MSSAYHLLAINIVSSCYLHGISMPFTYHSHVVIFSFDYSNICLVEHLSNADEILGEMFLEEKTPTIDDIKVRKLPL